MTASDTQRERTTSALDMESTAERAYRTSRTFRSVCSFVGGMILGFLPLFLFLLNHLTIAPPLFPFTPSLTFCYPHTNLPDAKIGMLDTVAFILYPIEACLGVPAIVGIGKVFHWRRSTITLCASGLLLAVVLELFFYFAFLFPLAWHQCFHLVGVR
jgi:O-antigen ligase